MAFTESWDDATPTDTDFADEGDDELRKIKRMLTERFDELFVGWPNTDPLQLKSAALDVGILSDGVEADLPNPATTAFYHATDSGKLYAKNGVTYEQVGSGTSGSTTNISASAMRRITSTQTITIAAVADGTRNFATLEHVVVGAAFGDYIVLGARMRLKPTAAPAYTEDANWRTSWDSVSFGWTASQNVPAHVSPVGSGYIEGGIWDVTERRSGSDALFATAAYVHNSSGASASIDIEVVLYLLALDSDSPAD